MDNTIIISVIIPTYNAEQYIRRAVESVLCQMNGQVELILVDDGSTDNSGIICDQYASSHADIHVVHKVNGGLSSARNAGIDLSSGQYLIFLDADDYLDPNTFASLYTIISSHHPDMIDYGWKYVSHTGEISENRHKLPKGILLDYQYIRDTILPPLLNLCDDQDHFIYDFACTKCFRTDLIHQKNIRFDVTRRIWEDRPFCVTYLRECNNFYSCSESFYNYVDMPNSLSRRYHLEYFDVILKNYRLYVSIYKDQYDFTTSYVNTYWANAIERMVFRSLEQKENLEQIHQNILQTLQNEMVVQWFSQRTCTSAFEKKVSALIAVGENNAALSLYQKEYNRRQKQKKCDAAILLFKRAIKKLTGR